MRKLLKGQGTTPRVMVPDKLRSYSAAKDELMPRVEHRSHKGLNSRGENSHLPVRRPERRMMRFKSERQCQRFVLTHDQIVNLFLLHQKELTTADHRQFRFSAPPRPGRKFRPKLLSRPSACFSTNAICASESFDPFIGTLLLPSRDHRWKIPAINGPVQREHVTGANSKLEIWVKVTGSRYDLIIACS